jgi:hypothetical protein
MRKPKIVMTIMKEDIGYSAYAYIKPYSINTQGDTFEELQDMIIDVVNLTFEEEGFTYTIDEIRFKLDMASFFEFYKVINAKALSARIGMNQSLLAQYIKGIKKPSQKQTKRIMEGVRTLGRELADIEFLM